MFKRKTYYFRHPEADAAGEGALKIKARSENKAWKKLEKELIRIMFGPGALIYWPDQVRKVKKGVWLENPD